MPHLFERGNFKVLMKQNTPNNVEDACRLRGRAAENRNAGGKLTERKTEEQTAGAQSRKCLSYVPSTPRGK